MKLSHFPPLVASGHRSETDSRTWTWTGSSWSKKNDSNSWKSRNYKSPWGSCEFRLLLITCNQVSQFCSQHEWMWDLGFSLTWTAIKQLRNITSIILISCFLLGYAGLPGSHGQGTERQFLMRLCFKLRIRQFFDFFITVVSTGQLRLKWRGNIFQR